MIDAFVQAWNARKGEVEAKFTAAHPSDYAEIVKAVVGIVGAKDEYELPSTERIHQIDDGCYQGTLVFVVGAGGYQPSDYWYVKIGYGSCSGCDTLEHLRDYRDDPPTAEQVVGYMTLALHIVQGLKRMGDDVV